MRWSEATDQCARGPSEARDRGQLPNVDPWENLVDLGKFGKIDNLDPWENFEKLTILTRGKI